MGPREVQLAWSSSTNTDKMLVSAEEMHKKRTGVFLICYLNIYRFQRLLPLSKILSGVPLREQSYIFLVERSSKHIVHGALYQLLLF